MRNPILPLLFLSTLSVGAAVSDAQPARAPVRGVEYVAAVNVPPKNAKVEARLFIPDGVNRIRGVIVVIFYGLGGTPCCYYTDEWRALAKTLGFVLLNPRFSAMSTESRAALWNDARLGGADLLFSGVGSVSGGSQAPGA